MTKKQFFDGVPFTVGKYHGVYAFRPCGESDPVDGVISERTGLRYISWEHRANIEMLHPRGVRVYSFWLGKRVSRFLFFHDLIALEPAKDLATV